MSSEVSIRCRYSFSLYGLWRWFLQLYLWQSTGSLPSGIVIQYFMQKEIIYRTYSILGKCPSHLICNISMKFLCPCSMLSKSHFVTSGVPLKIFGSLNPEMCILPCCSSRFGDKNGADLQIVTMLNMKIGHWIWRRITSFRKVPLLYDRRGKICTRIIVFKGSFLYPWTINSPTKSSK